MSRFLSEKYSELKECVQAEIQTHKKVVKLDTNESPYPASPFVYRSIDQFEMENLRLYSDPEAGKLVAAIAENYGIEENQIAVGNGSDELLAFSFMVFQSKEKNFYFPEISYISYAAYAELFRANKIEVPLQENLSIKPEDYFNLNGTIVIANPNTPTGIALAASDIERIAEANKDNLVIVDEAYIDFGGESCIPLIQKLDNLLVIQTFSKARNLAGARVGFAVANPEIINDLKRIRTSFNRYNINRLSIIAGTAAMRDKDYFKKCINDTKRMRDRLAKEMEILDFTVIPSKTNFLLVKSNSMSGEEYYNALKEKNILVKRYDFPQIKDYVRITIGKAEQMDVLIKATKDILGIEEPRME